MATMLDPNSMFPDVRPALRDEQIRMMLASAMRSPALFAEFRERLDPGLLNGDGERGLHVVWTRALDLVTRYGIGMLSSEHFRAHLEPAVRAEFACNVEYSHTTVDDIVGEPGGFLPYMFSLRPEANSEGYVRDLLRLFLLERVLHFPLQRLAFNYRSGQVVADVDAVVIEMARRAAAIGGAGATPARTLQGDWDEHLRRLAMYRGRSLIGLRTGLRHLDDHLLGARGLIVFGAAPNVGKTTYAIQAGLGAADPANENNAVFLCLSLEMQRWEVAGRIVCNRAHMDWKTLHFGSPGLREGRDGVYFSPEHLNRLDRVAGELGRGELGRRVLVLDRETVGQTITAATILARLNALKQSVGATRAMVVIDYLQLLPVPDEVARRGDLEADRYRVQLVQEVVAATRTAANPAGDAVLVISEARKPPSASKGSWGRDLSELMGSARLPYAADAVLLYRVMTARDVERHYPEAVGDVEAYMRTLEEQGVSPVVLRLAKARDGMTRGEWPNEFLFRESRFRELRPAPTPPSPTGGPLPPPAARRPAAPRPILAPGDIQYRANRNLGEMEARN